MLFRRKRQQIYLYYIIFPEEKKDVFMIRWKKIFAALPLLLTAGAGLAAVAGLWKTRKK